MTCLAIKILNTLIDFILNLHMRSIGLHDVHEALHDVYNINIYVDTDLDVS